METVHPFLARSSVALPGALDTIFQPDTITPQQWNDQWHRPTELTPEQRLIVAVMEDAKGCFKVPAKGPVAIKRQFEAEMWFWDDSIKPFSFRWCCEMLDWNPIEVRNHIREMPPQKKIGRRCPVVHNRGGIARAATLSPEQRQESARKAANERWLHNLGYR